MKISNIFTGKRVRWEDQVTYDELKGRVSTQTIDMRNLIRLIRTKLFPF